MKRPRRQLPEQPKAIVVAAYQAASRGQYSLLHRRTDRVLRVQLAKNRAKTRAEVAAAERYIRGILSRIVGRRDSKAVKTRKTLRSLLRIGRLLTGRVGLTKSERDLAKRLIRGRTPARIEATRQIVRGRKAKVYFKVTLENGTVIRETESLVLRDGRWYFG